jgi:integrase
MELKKKGLNVSFYLLTPTAKQTLVYVSISEKNRSASSRLRFSSSESFLSHYCNKRFDKKTINGKVIHVKNGKEILKRNTTFYLEYQSKLNKITEILHEIYNEFQKSGKQYILEDIRDIYYLRSGLITVAKVSVESAFNEYIIFNISQWGTATQTKVYSTLKHLTNYEEKYGKINLEVANIYLFNSVRDKYLVGDLKLGNGTVNKYMQYIEAFFKFSKKKGYIMGDLDFDETKSLEEIEPFKIALKLHEVDILSKLDLSDNLRLDRVRDELLLGVFTCQRWSDLEKVKGEFNISGKSISLTQKKTNKRVSIPLFPKLRDHLEKLLAKYPDGFPTISNQNFNEYIKEVGELCGFKERHTWVTLSGKIKKEHTDFRFNLISSHTGRRTFCTLALKQGINPIEIMKISGHKKIETFRQYVKIDDEYLNDAFENFLN